MTANNVSKEINKKVEKSNAVLSAAETIELIGWHVRKIIFA
jgi:hypothetical protein